MNRYLLIILLIFGNFYCDIDRSKDYKLTEYFNKYNISLDSLKAIFVLDEVGCVTCNKSFSNLITYRLDNPKIKLILISRGSLIDISSLIKSKNTIIDFGGTFYKLGLCQNSSAILLKNGKIDTIIEINATNLKNNLLYLDEKIQNN